MTTQEQLNGVLWDAFHDELEKLAQDPMKADPSISFTGKKQTPLDATAAGKQFNKKNPAKPKGDMYGKIDKLYQQSNKKLSGGSGTLY